MFLTKSLEELKTSLSHDTDLLREQQNILIRSFLIEKLQTLVIKNEEKLFEYVDFCISNNKKAHTKRQTEKHHILLKSIFEEYSDLSKNCWNSTYLTYEDHYIAHALFAEAINHNSGIYAWWNMNSLNINKIDLGDKILDSERYSELRKLHYDVVSQLPHLRNKSQNCINKRKDTMSIPDDNGITGFQRNGQKISKSLKESGACAGENNSSYDKNIIKDRKRPEIKFASSRDFNRSVYVPVNTGYILLYDNVGQLYFHGWRDECIEYCNSIGLDGNKVPSKTKKCFEYKDRGYNKYILKLMKLSGLDKYISGNAVLISDKEATVYIKNKEEFL